MNANVFRNVLETALPADKVVSMARALKVVERQSLIAIDQLVTALVLVVSFARSSSAPPFSRR